ncbi:MAG: sigma-54 dependent transcriptional regulator [bacterium]
MDAIRFPKLPILLVDDEKKFLQSLSITLRSNNINNIELCEDSRNVLMLLSKKKYQLILLDLYMPFISGDELLPSIVSNFPDTPVIIITAVDKVETAVECIKTGAFNYLVKPVNEERVVTNVRMAIEHRELQSEIELLTHYLLSENLEHPESFSSIITRNSGMLSLFKYVEAVAATTLPILITGETGVGKELFAKAIHDVSGRKGRFVTVNSGGLDDNLFSDTLFGHKKGAFTGAEKDRDGLIRHAGEGTLFLDEIGDLKIESQIKLLRLLQDGKYYPVGSDIEKFSSARIIAATNQDIAALVEEKKFRNDLYYRLKAHHVLIPPLRERKEDIPLLVDYYLEEASKKLNKEGTTPPKELQVLLNTYHFPGNIRELQGMIFDAVSRVKTKKLPLDTFKKQMGYKPDSNSDIIADRDLNIKNGLKLILNEYKYPTLKDAEQLLIEEALLRTQGNQTLAAEMLGISRAALYKRLKRSSS